MPPSAMLAAMYPPTHLSLSGAFDTWLFEPSTTSAALASSIAHGRSSLPASLTVSSSTAIPLHACCPLTSPLLSQWSPAVHLPSLRYAPSAGAHSRGYRTNPASCSSQTRSLLQTSCAALRSWSMGARKRDGRSRVLTPIFVRLHVSFRDCKAQRWSGVEPRMLCRRCMLLPVCHAANIH